MIIKIPIHSFIDLITNSSSETYVCPSSKTVELARELLGTFLANAGIQDSVDGVFDIKLVAEYYDSDKDEYVTDENYGDRESAVPELQITVKPAYSTNLAIVAIAKTVVSFGGSFHATEICC